MIVFAVATQNGLPETTKCRSQKHLYSCQVVTLKK